MFQTVARVQVESLEGIVDVAIDSNRRVIELADSNQYVVLVDGTQYRYTAPTPPQQVTEGEQSIDSQQDEGLLETFGVEPLFNTTEKETATDAADSRTGTNGEIPVRMFEEVGQIHAERLAESDIKTLEELLSAESDKIATIADVSENRAKDWITQAEKRLEHSTSAK